MDQPQSRTPHEEAYQRITHLGFRVNESAFFATKEPAILVNDKLYIKTGDSENPLKSFLWWTYEFITKQTLPPNTRLKRYNKDPFDYHYENIYVPYNPRDNQPNDEALTERMVLHLLQYLGLMDDVAPPSTLRNVDAPSSDMFSIIDLVTELRQGMAMLSPDDRDLLIAIHFEDRKVKDVGAQLQTTPQNVSIKAKKILNKLSRIMNDRFKWHVLISDFKQFGF